MINKVLYLLLSLIIVFGFLTVIIEYSGLNAFLVYGLGLPVGLILLFANKEKYISNLNSDVNKDFLLSRKKNGLHTEYYFSFNPFSPSPKKCEISYKDGKIDGTRTQFYKNGQKGLESTYKDGKCISGDF